MGTPGFLLGDLDCFPSFWLEPWPTLVVAGIWKVKQEIPALSLFVSQNKTQLSTSLLFKILPGMLSLSL